MKEIQNRSYMSLAEALKIFEKPDYSTSSIWRKSFANDEQLKITRKGPYSVSARRDAIISRYNDNLSSDECEKLYNNHSENCEYDATEVASVAPSLAFSPESVDSAELHETRAQMPFSEPLVTKEKQSSNLIQDCFHSESNDENGFKVYTKKVDMNQDDVDDNAISSVGTSHKKHRDCWVDNGDRQSDDALSSALGCIRECYYEMPTTPYAFKEDLLKTNGKLLQDKFVAYLRVKRALTASSLEREFETDTLPRIKTIAGTSVASEGEVPWEDNCLYTTECRSQVDKPVRKVQVTHTSTSPFIRHWIYFQKTTKISANNGSRTMKPPNYLIAELRYD